MLKWWREKRIQIRTQENFIVLLYAKEDDLSYELKLEDIMVERNR